jgi:hypothetical protein
VALLWLNPDYLRMDTLASGASNEFKFRCELFQVKSVFKVRKTICSEIPAFKDEPDMS